VAEQTAGSVAAVMDMLTAVGTAASAAARAEAERHTEALHADGHAGPLEPWDWPYYAARERRARHAVDDARLQEFFVLDRVMDDGLFALARDLYGLTFAARDDLPRPHPDARVWTVTGADGRDRGELYVDPFARDGKSGGAWLDAFAEPAPLTGRLPRAVIVLNATRPAGDAPVLLTPLDVRILFHEFGHALHLLLSDVTFPRVAGLNVPIDVVEFPSKLHESLAFEPAVVARYARHHETGAPLSEADVGALQASVRDGAAFTSTQGTGNALLDQAWHGLAPGEAVDPDAVDAFEEAVLERHGMVLRAVGLHYRSTFFAHIFEGGMAGTHYAYTWSAMLEEAALAWLDEQGGPTRAAGEGLREGLLARGAVVEPLAALREITGREASVEPMLERRGLL
jgi:peptidyl-dipeptidase Dcp